jgi:tetratricopeptide (TPR) repeat protein
LELKGRAEACQTAALPPTPPVVPTIEERLKTAAVMVESGDCLGALSQHINPALEIDPLNVDATELKKKAESCGQPPPTPLPPTATNQPPKTLPPEQGGLPRVAGENEKNYLSRVETMKARYAEAESTLSAADYPKAATLFDGILRDAGPQYMNVMEKLAEAKGRSKEAAQKSIQAARDLEKKGEWEGAAEAYRRARLLDSSVNVDGDIKRISGLRIAEGRKVCDEANARYSYSRTAEALQLYQEAVKLLPQDDPCVGIARERFPSLRR